MERTRFLLALSGLFQVLVIVLGFICLSIIMKFNGYPEELLVRWNPLASALRVYGIWMLLVPLIWASITAVACQRENGPLSINFAITLGYVLGVVALAMFLYATMNSYTRPLFIHAETTKQHPSN